MRKVHSDVLKASVPFAREILFGSHLDVREEIEIFIILILAALA